MKEITDRLDPSEFQFDMITLRLDSNLPRREKMGNIMVHRIGFSSLGAKVSDRSMPFVCKVAKVLFPLTAFFKATMLHWKNQQGDALLVWAMMANQAGFGALFFCWLYPETKMFLELQDGRPIKEMKARRPILRAFWFLYRRIYLRADMIKCISTFIGTEVRSVGYRGPLRVIPNGVDVAYFSAAIPEKMLDELKHRFDKKSGDMFLFTASRLVLSRGVEDIIQALAELPPHVKLLIAGEGEDRKKLEHIARGLEVSDRVSFAGFAPHKDLPAYFKISDIFVRPSRIEGMGNAFIEAFAAGIPVIGTPVGGIPDFLTEGETGLFCEVENPHSIALAVKRYLAERDLRERIVGNAKQLAAERYDWSLITLDMKDKIFNTI